MPGTEHTFVQRRVGSDWHRNFCAGFRIGGRYPHRIYLPEEPTSVSLVMRWMKTANAISYPRMVQVSL